MKVLFLIPESTIQLERSRMSQSSSAFEFFQCFAGDFEIRDRSDKTILRLTDAPLLRLAADLGQALCTVVRNRTIVTIYDFYDEFELKVIWAGPQYICIEKIGTEEHVEADYFELGELVRDAVRSLLANIDSLFPSLAANDDYREFRNQLIAILESINPERA
jgi:hypothetical protein